MSKRRRHAAAMAPMVRMSDKEKAVVRYVSEKLLATARNPSGKLAYARSLDQVMHDLFGIKKFTKVMDRARYNEALMINLMKTLEIDTLWGITRSKEYYRIFTAAVALDATIVKQLKKYERMMEMEPAQRPTRRIRKMEKSIKRNKRLYKDSIKTFRSIFDIEKVSNHTGGNAITDALRSFVDQHTMDDDIFYGLDYDLMRDDVESMDAFVKRTMRGNQRNGRAPSGGALGLFDDELDLGDDDDIFSQMGDELEEDDGSSDALNSQERKVFNLLLKRYANDMGRANNVPYSPEMQQVYQGPSGRVTFDEMDEEEDDNSAELMLLAQTMNRGFDSINRNIERMVGVMNGGVMPNSGRPVVEDGVPTLADMLDMSNPPEGDSDDEDPEEEGAES